MFPCQPSQKIPATRHGYQDATTDPEQITGWFTRRPGYNLAIATGAPGPDVLDVDVHGAAGNGYAALGQLHCAGLLEDAFGYVRTPSGGLHIYSTGTTQHCGHLPGHHVDFRSSGGLRPGPALPGRRPPLPPLGNPRPRRHPELGARLPPRPALPAPAARTPPGPGPGPRHPGPVGRYRQRQGNRNAGLYWAANRALEADPAADLSPLADAARQAGLADREISRTLDSGPPDRPCPPRTA